MHESSSLSQRSAHSWTSSCRVRTMSSTDLSSAFRSVSRSCSRADDASPSWVWSVGNWAVWRVICGSNSCTSDSGVIEGVAALLVVMSEIR